MHSENCVFCKIIKKQIPSKIIKETDNVIVIEDLHPKAPFHYLMITKKHIVNINHMVEEDFKYILEMTKISQELSKEIQEKQKENDPVDFNIISNNGPKAGQSVFHLHWHFLAGKNLYTSGLSL